MIIEDPDEKADYDEELVLVLDDWIDGTGTNPDQVLENLRETGMKPMEPGGPGVTPTTPLGADGGDVTYPYFVINGRVRTDPQDAGLPCRTTHPASGYQCRIGYRVSRRRARHRPERHRHRRLSGDAHRCEVGHPRHGRARRRHIHGRQVGAAWSPCRRASRATRN